MSRDEGGFWSGSWNSSHSEASSVFVVEVGVLGRVSLRSSRVITWTDRRGEAARPVDERGRTARKNRKPRRLSMSEREGRE